MILPKPFGNNSVFNRVSWRPLPRGGGGGVHNGFAWHWVLAGLKLEFGNLAGEGGGGFKMAFWKAAASTFDCAEPFEIKQVCLQRAMARASGGGTDIKFGKFGGWGEVKSC